MVVPLWAEGGRGGGSGKDAEEDVNGSGDGSNAPPAAWWWAMVGVVRVSAGDERSRKFLGGEKSRVWMQRSIHYHSCLCNVNSALSVCCFLMSASNDG